MKLVAYLRVSTDKQGRSGLGLDAQRDAIAAYCREHQGIGIIATFTEVQSGKRNDRPELANALLRCRQTGAVLLVAKLDRLSRDASFLLQLRNSSVKFICADMPEANDLTIGLLAILAEHERKMISKRTKEALQAAKARGVKLGNPNPPVGTVEAARAASEAAQEAYAARAADLRPAIEEALKFAEPGMVPAKVVSTYFALMGIPSPHGKSTWNIETVRRLLKFLQIQY